MKIYLKFKNGNLGLLINFQQTGRKEGKTQLEIREIKI